MKKKKKQVSGDIGPRMDWQKGEYSRCARFNLILPYDFLLLCKLLDTTPARVISDFLSYLSPSCRIHGSENVRNKLREYFVEYGYINKARASETIQSIFRELELISSLYPDSSNHSLLDLHEKWRDAYLVYWFEKWNSHINAAET